MFSYILEKIGKTPLIRLKQNNLNNINLYGKLEFYNPTGSVKDRAALYIIQKLLDIGVIDKDSILIESTSGNFGIALAAYCKMFNLKFYSVVDPNIASINESIIKRLSTEMIKVTQPDNSGGYLLNRIKKVKELLDTIPKSYWVNQYGNKYIVEAYYNTIGDELCNDLENIDYIFIGVSSGGTITGISQRIKEKFPNSKVIAVDSVGSVIFGGPAKKRYIPGIGSSMKPDNLKHACIDDVVMVEESDAIKMCHRIMKENFIVAGGSSGAVLSAIESYFQGKTFYHKPNVVAIFADRGDRYANTIYDEKWCSNFLAN